MQEKDLAMNFVIVLAIRLGGRLGLLNVSASNAS